MEATQRILAFLERDFVRYILVGATTVGVDFGLLVLLHQSLHIEIYLAASLSFWTSIIVNFSLNKLWTFGVRHNTPYHAFSYGVLILSNYLISLGFIYLLGQVGVNYIFAKLAYIGCSTLWNFALYKWLIFTDKPLTLVLNGYKKAQN